MKIEVDLRTAKRIDTYRVGDAVKVLVPSYGNNYNVYPGVIAGFDDFAKLPSITIAYLETGYNKAELKAVVLNSATTAESKVEIVPADSAYDLILATSNVEELMIDAINKKKAEMQELESKLEYFRAYFGKHFGAAKETLSNTL